MKNPIEPLLISDLLMLPSETSFGLAAFDHGCRSSGGVKQRGWVAEVNVQGASGFLCDVGDVESMAKAAKPYWLLKRFGFKHQAKLRAQSFTSTRFFSISGCMLKPSK